MRKLTITCASAVLALAAAATAAATPPTKTHVTVLRSIPNYLPCPGFAVRGEFLIDRTTTTFYDGTGTPIRTVQHVHADATLSNPLTGKSLPDSSDFKITTDLATGERSFDGKVNVATSPGEGVVYQAVGRIVFEPDGSVIEDGPHDDADGSFDVLCNYLASP